MKRIVSNVLSLQFVHGFFKHLVDLTIDECCLKQLHTKMKEVDNKEVPQNPDRLLSVAKKESKNTCKCKSGKHREICKQLPLVAKNIVIEYIEIAKIQLSKVTSV